MFMYAPLFSVMSQYLGAEKTAAGVSPGICSHAKREREREREREGQEAESCRIDGG